MLALSFLNPALLSLFALAAIPLAIYLFNRQRYRTIPWAAMEFVLRALKKNKRRLQFENILLLLLRVAAILLLVAGIARPVGRALGPLEDLTEKRRHLAILIDNSYSMGYRQGAQSSFERAKAAAKDLADSLLKRGDRFALATVAGEPRFLYPDPVFVDDLQKARILSEIQELELSAGPTDAGKALAALTQQLPRFSAGAAAEGIAKQVFILTDMQKSAFATDRGLRDPNVHRAAKELERLGAEVVWIDCGAEDPANLAVTRLDMPDEIAGVDMPVRIVATVRSFAPQAANDVSLDFFVDDLLQGSKPLSLEPGEEKEVELYATFREKGPHKVHVVLKTDDLPVDNARYLAVEAREAVDTLVVDGERKPEFGDSETDFLVTALAPGEDSRIGRENLIRPRVVPDSALAEEDLSKAGVVIMANVIALSDEQVERLETYVRRGGGLLLFLGPQVDRAIWNEKLWKDGKSLLPGPIGATVIAPEEDRFYALGADTFDHPILRPFASADTRPLFATGRFTGYQKLEIPEHAEEDPNVSVLVRFDPRRASASGESGDAGAGGARGDPALVEKHFGRGRILIFASTADREWNTFFTQYAYLMLWQKAVTYLADAGSARRNLLVGETYEQIVPSTEYAPAIFLTTPAQDPIEKTLEKIPDEPDRFRLVHAETGRPGFYEVKFAGGGEGVPGAGPGTGTSAERVDFFAVNVEPDEADLAKIDAKELEALVPEMKVRVEPDKGLDRLVRAPDRGGAENELWRYALYALLSVLIAESGLACWFGRKAK